MFSSMTGFRYPGSGFRIAPNIWYENRYFNCNISAEEDASLTDDLDTRKRRYSYGIHLSFHGRDVSRCKSPVGAVYIPPAACKSDPYFPKHFLNVYSIRRRKSLSSFYLTPLPPLQRWGNIAERGLSSPLSGTKRGFRGEILSISHLQTAAPAVPAGASPPDRVRQQ